MTAVSIMSFPLILRRSFRCVDVVNVQLLLGGEASVRLRTSAELRGMYSPGRVRHYYAPTRSCAYASSPFDPKVNHPNENSSAKKRRRRLKFVPRKAAVTLTDPSRQFFRRLLEKPPRPEIIGVMLHYDQASSGEPRMVFRFSFVSQDELHPNDEGVSLEVTEEGTPKSPTESENDGLSKLYIHHNAFLKVLGCTVDVNTETLEPILYDREGNTMDPNA